ncbi:hypothetical protein [Endozoicomonas sp. YOMI1]|uniref:hypothetical protein n=1 Tax=Endozoicomonas sp. YOMI1 TaxID=2828739 RepID=UPI0021481EAA|nr:hypothetical protein [Endozoicomonas sp. YOMI1]
MRTDKTTENYLQQPAVTFHNPFDDPRFEKRSIVVVDSHAKEDQPLYLPVRIKPQNNDHAPTYIPDNECFSIQSILGLGQSNSQCSSVIDIHYNPCEITNPLPNNHNLVDLFSTPKVPVSITNPQLNSKQLQRNTSPAGTELDFKASASGESLTISHHKAYQKVYQRSYSKSEKRKASRKAYAQSEKGKASRRAYAQSEKRKALRRAYAQSEKGKASRKAYAQSEKGKAYIKAYQKAYQKAYRQSEKGKAYHKAYAQTEERKAYRKAYYKVFMNTGDKEQAKIAGKQAAAFIIESNKAKNSELESTSISPLPPAFQTD